MSRFDSIANPVKDERGAHPVATAWRPVLAEIVRAFARGDYGLSKPLAAVEAVTKQTAEQIRAYVGSYGATLVELSAESWDTSCAQWMGDHWEVLVDLWTKEEGHSDLVLFLKVVESGGEPRFSVQSVHVP